MKKRYLVTGGSGFLGNELINRILQGGNEVVVVARNEGKLLELREKFPTIQIMTGDISDIHIARQAVSNVDGIYHLAGFKHVGLAEKQPKECILSNVIGSLALLQATDGKKYDFIIGISTDKAAQVAGAYGASKLLMEYLFQQFESYNPQTKYRIVRYGNVLYSTGSVLCRWRESLLNKGDIIITDPKATRFFWTVNQAVDHIEECLTKSENSVPFIPHMKAIALSDLLEAMQLKYGRANSVKTIGLQPGENFAETMDGKVFSNQVEQYSIDEIINLI